MKYNLTNAVINHSESDSWDSAVREWDIVDFDVDDECSSQCVCGKESIKYLFTIRNRFNGHILDPIGSKCIKKFGRDDLSDQVDVCEQMAKLLEAVNDHKFIKFNSDLFSRKLLRYLYDNDCFPSTDYNHNEPYNDYKFLLDMFNKRTEPTQNQQRKITALVMSAIIPFCREKLNLSEP